MNTCFNCKYCYNNQCNNKDINKMLIVTDNTTNSVYKLFEEGYLSDFLRENLDTEYIVKNILKELKEQDYLKKNKNEKNFNSEQFENELVETYDSAISSFLVNQLKYIQTSVLSFKPSQDFSCMYWE